MLENRRPNLNLWHVDIINKNQYTNAHIYVIHSKLGLLKYRNLSPQ